MRDAKTVCRWLGITAKSGKRERRPSIEEMTRLEYFEDQARRRHSMPVHVLSAFALFSGSHRHRVRRRNRPTGCWGRLR